MRHHYKNDMMCFATLNNNILIIG